MLKSFQTMSVVAKLFKIPCPVTPFCLLLMHLVYCISVPIYCKPSMMHKTERESSQTKEFRWTIARAGNYLPQVPLLLRTRRSSETSGTIELALDNLIEQNKPKQLIEQNNEHQTSPSASNDTTTATTANSVSAALIGNNLSVPSVIKATTAFQGEPSLETNNNTSDTGNNLTVLELSALQAANLGYFRHSASISVILTIAYTIVFVVGIIGNSFVVAIVCKSPRMRTVTNYFIANLAFADILVLLFCLPATLFSNLFIPYVLGLFVCKTVSYLQGVVVSASINTMVAVTMDRFLAICFPMDWHMSRRAARWTIACVWLFSLIIALPWALFFTLVPYPLDSQLIQLCAEDWPSERWGTLYFLFANLILLYLLPAALIILCYLGIWYKIKRRNIPGDQPKGLKVELIIQKSKLKVVKMMMVVVIIFLLSWLPLYLIITRIKLAEERSPWEDWLISKVMPLAQWLGASNSCINPILYTFFNRKYKRGFIDLLRFGFCCKPVIPLETRPVSYGPSNGFRSHNDDYGQGRTRHLANKQQANGRALAFGAPKSVPTRSQRIQMQSMSKSERPSECGQQQSDSGGKCHPRRRTNSRDQRRSSADSGRPMSSKQRGADSVAGKMGAGSNSHRLWGTRLNHSSADVADYLSFRHSYKQTTIANAQKSLPHEADCLREAGTGKSGNRLRQTKRRSKLDSDFAQVATLGPSRVRDNEGEQGLARKKRGKKSKQTNNSMNDCEMNDPIGQVSSKMVERERRHHSNQSDLSETKKFKKTRKCRHVWGRGRSQEENERVYTELESPKEATSANNKQHKNKKSRAWSRCTSGGRSLKSNSTNTTRDTESTDVTALSFTTNGPCQELKNSLNSLTFIDQQPTTITQTIADDTSATFSVSTINTRTIGATTSNRDNYTLGNGLRPKLEASRSAASCRNLSTTQTTNGGRISGQSLATSGFEQWACSSESSIGHEDNENNDENISTNDEDETEDEETDFEEEEEEEDDDDDDDSIDEEEEEEIDDDDDDDDDDGNLLFGSADESDGCERNSKLNARGMKQPGEHIGQSLVATGSSLVNVVIHRLSSTTIPSRSSASSLMVPSVSNCRPLSTDNKPHSRGLSQCNLAIDGAKQHAADGPLKYNVYYDAKHYTDPPRVSFIDSATQPKVSRIPDSSSGSSRSRLVSSDRKHVSPNDDDCGDDRDGITKSSSNGERTEQRLFHGRQVITGECAQPSKGASLKTDGIMEPTTKSTERNIGTSGSSIGGFNQAASTVIHSNPIGH